jgi:hypothetical protein
MYDEIQIRRLTMRRESITLILLFLVSVFQLRDAQSVSAQEAVLEAYTIGQGSIQVSSLEGLDARLTDKGFGGSPGLGTAKSIVELNTESIDSSLFLRVFRKLPPGTIAFALIVTRTEVRAFDINGTSIYSRDLDGFVFGDSAPGDWSRTLTDLPPNVAQLKVTFFGNYE